ncbi:TolC family outer membrane protein [Marinovum sp. 2_MG-2023]|uniref:TolC family outer membrane protein n=1 Tax=unclassified Marinovum TaxID=2647166 RepID=UPI0026E23546|nr:MULTISPECIES: TolC family outer membrane protein [unclassified Marinovum]MDO6732444.1 TolC family outer membrane protein [Marinovum sp. 2_MG-2023]MDO6781723.1 TolC family outer membrane protein [Marinovum sp. 1_MG-2023]
MIGKTMKLSAKRLMLAFTVAAVPVFAPLAATAETLADALAGAYDHSGLLQQNRALLRAADEDVAVSVAQLRPILGWAASFSRDFGYSNAFSTSAGTFVGSGSQSDTASFAITAELLLYDFGASRLRIDAAKETVLATREGLIAIEQSVLLRAATAFVNVHRAAETVALRQNNLRLVQQELRAARDRFEVGEVTRTDVSLAEARLASSRANLAASEGELQQAAEEYNAAVGHKPGNLVPVTRLPQLESNVDTAKAIAQRTHPDMKQAQHQVATADLNVRRAEAAMKPTVKLTGRLAKTGDFDSEAFSNSGSVSLDFSGPIYRGGELSALARQAAARSDAARSNLHVVQHAVALRVGNAMAGYRVANASIEATQRQIAAARVAFRGVREEASLGQRTTLDVLTAEQELLDAETAYTSAVADRAIAAYQVLSSMGLMTAKHLALNVQQYDPAEYYRLIKNAPAKSLQGDKLDRVLRRIGD